MSKIWCFDSCLKPVLTDIGILLKTKYSTHNPMGQILYLEGPLIKVFEIKGPDNPTSQLLPIMSKKCCCADGEGRKDKGRGGGKMVCDKVVCMKDGRVKDGV